MGIDDLTFEMTAYRGNELQLVLPCNIWVGIKSILSKNQKVPHIKFQNNKETKFNVDQLVAISIDSDCPDILDKDIQLKLQKEEIEQIFGWIKQNYISLMQLWNEEISYRQFGNRVCK